MILLDVAIPAAQNGDAEFWTKLISIENLFGTAGAAVLVWFISNVIRYFFKFNALVVSFFVSLPIAAVMVYLSNMEGSVYCCFVTLVNAALISGIAYSISDIPVKLQRRRRRTKGNGKMAASGEEADESNKGFLSSWL